MKDQESPLNTDIYTLMDTQNLPLALNQYIGAARSNPQYKWRMTQG